MNKEISYGSPEETRRFSQRMGPSCLEAPPGAREAFDEAMEEYDPDGKRAYEIAMKYAKKEEEK